MCIICIYVEAWYIHLQIAPDILRQERATTRAQIFQQGSALLNNATSHRGNAKTSHRIQQTVYSLYFKSALPIQHSNIPYMYAIPLSMVRNNCPVRSSKMGSQLHQPTPYIWVYIYQSMLVCSS